MRRKRRALRKPQPAPGKLEKLRTFVNTAAGRRKREELGTPAELGRWFKHRGLLGDDEKLTLDEHASAIAARRNLRSILAVHNGGGPNPEAVEGLAELLVGMRFEPRLEADGSVRFEPVSPGILASLGKLLAIVAVAQNAGSWRRLKICADPECGTAFYDTSGKATWCSTRCGDRVRGRKFRRSYKGRRLRTGGREGLAAVFGLEGGQAE
ncbi:MAG: CGNR zinc finger domain-containing protein [bacterium]|nr:CGNR zinc finger domain-containing protein [bacterium]